MMAARHGYASETHEVITEDGYVLTMHRLPRGRWERNQFVAKEERPVVYIQHGFTSSSADWLVSGPNRALGRYDEGINRFMEKLPNDIISAYVLADNGYDVWLGNYRGNQYSREHLTMDPDSVWDNDYWHFS